MTDAKNRVVGQRSMSAEPPTVEDRLHVTEYRTESVTPSLRSVTCSAKPESSKASSSTGKDAKMASTAKVNAWLETMCDNTSTEMDDLPPQQSPRDALDVTTTNLASLQLEPIGGEGNLLDSRTDGRVFGRLQGRAIPPISNASKGEDIEKIASLVKDEGNEGDDDDVCTTLATVDSETSSPVLSGDPAVDTEQDSNNTTTQGSNPTKGERPVHQLPKDVVINVQEVGDASTSAKEDVCRPKDLSVSKKDDPEPKSSGVGKLSFGGIANTLLQWKLNKMRAEKRRSQSIAIDARHFALMGAIADKIKIQLPRSLVYSLKEEAHPILVETVQAS